MANTLTNKTIMAPANYRYDDELEERVQRRIRAASEKDAEKLSRDTDINTIKYEINNLRSRVNKLEDANAKLSVVSDTIMKELKIKDPMFQKELRQKVSKMIKKLKT